MELRDTIVSPFFANHFWYQYIDPIGIYCNSGPAIPCVFFFYIYLGYMLLKKAVSKLLAKINLKIFSFNDDIEECFKPYFQNLALNDLEWSIDQEQKSRDIFRYACKPDNTYQSFKDSKKELEDKDSSGLKDHSSNLVQGIHSYNILKNPEYQRAF